MEIIEIAHENQNIIKGLNNSNLNNTIASYPQNNSIENNNSTEITLNTSIYDKFYHKNYLSLLYFSILAFFVLGYYLLHTAKINLKRIKSTNTESTASIAKFENIKKLAYANFLRGISLVYIVLTYNKNTDDLESFFNYLMHIFPSLIFCSIFLSYISFLIEKYYEITTKKSDILLDPSMQFFNILVYIIFIILAFSSLGKNISNINLHVARENYIDFHYYGSGIISLLYIILGFLFIFYGTKLSGIYAEIKENVDIKERKFIHNKILCITLITGTLFLAKAFFSFLITINFFRNTHPNFLYVNIWDFLNFLMTEFLTSLVIGYSRQQHDKKNSVDKSNFESFEFNKNLTNATMNAKRDIDKNYVLINELSDPLLDKMERSISREN